MIIFLEEITMQLFLWFLKLADGMMEIFSSLTGVSKVTYHGNEVNLLELVLGDTTTETIFWCLFILAIGLSCIFLIVGLVKNMIQNNKNTSSIVGKFFLSVLGMMALLVVVMLGILIANSVLQLIARIFQIENTTKLSTKLFEACVGDWINGYSIREFDIDTVTVRDILGDYQSTFTVFPTVWVGNGMINPKTFMYLPSLIASIGVMVALLIAIINLAKRIYEIVFLYFTMPLAVSTLAADDGARFKKWTETFISKVLIAYGAVFAVNVFVLLMPIVTKVNVVGISVIGNKIFRIIMIIAGAMMIPSGQVLFARMFGQADDMHASGGGFFSRAFYGARIIGSMTFGAISRIAHRGGHHGGQQGNNGNNTNNSSVRYSEGNSNTGGGEG